MFCDMAKSLEIIFKKLFCSLTCCITQGSLIHTVQQYGKISDGTHSIYHDITQSFTETMKIQRMGQGK